jgi:hypothetical protein
MIPGVDARNGILSALGHPRCTVRSDDNTVGCRAFAEIDQFERAIPRIEPPQRAVALAGEPDRAIRGGSAGMARAPAAAELRNWRRFIALPRLYEKEGLDAQINLTPA